MSLKENPIELFNEWYQRAVDSEPDYPEAMTLATVDEEGNPHARVVLLKSYGEDGFVFFTNYHSHKGRNLLTHPRASLCFYWKSLSLQIRIRGDARPVSEEEADAYFATRPRESQLGAWASHQSTELESRAELFERYHRFEEKYTGQDIPRPPHWSGFRIVPVQIEFWSEGPHRLHHRRLYKRREDGTWKSTILSP